MPLSYQQTREAISGHKHGNYHDFDAFKNRPVSGPKAAPLQWWEHPGALLGTVITAPTKLVSSVAGLECDPVSEQSMDGKCVKKYNTYLGGRKKGRKSYKKSTKRRRRKSYRRRN
jgi:hypothetical protein